MNFSRRSFLSLSTAALMPVAAGPVAAAPVSAGKASVPTPQRLFHRGVGIHSAMNWGSLKSGSTSHYEPRPFEEPRSAFPEALVQELVPSGFDFVRLSLDVGPFIQLQGSDRTALEQKLVSNIEKLLARGLNVLVDCHPVEQVPLYSVQSILGDLESSLFADYRATIVRLATILAGLPANRVALELMNEPALANASHRTQVMVWGAAQLSLHDAARRAAPDLPLMLTGANYGGISGLNDLDPDPYTDSNVLFSYHYYFPIAFTHQGVDYGFPDAPSAGYISDLPYPSDAVPPAEIEAALEARIAALNLEPRAKAAASAHARRVLKDYLAEDWNRDRMANDFAFVAQWADRHGIAHDRIVMGEFGVTRRSDRLVGAAEIYRKRWMADATELAQANGFGWSIWDLNSYQMGISRLDDESRLDRDLLAVLTMSG